MKHDSLATAAQRYTISLVPSPHRVLLAISASRAASIALILRHRARVICQVNNNTIPQRLH